MSIIDQPLTEIPFDQLASHIARLKEYLRNTDTPNQISSDGKKSCVTIALTFCDQNDGIEILDSLLAKGADPNQPTPFQNFYTYTLVGRTIAPLVLLVDHGLELNQVYEPHPEILLSGKEISFTILDYARDIAAYLTKDRQFASLAKKYAGGGIGARRRFIDETIEFLESRDARSATDFG